MPFRVGDRVRAVDSVFGWDMISPGDEGVITDTIGSDYIVSFQHVMSGLGDYNWRGAEQDLELVAKKAVKVRRTAVKLVPADDREKTAVKLIKRVVTGEGKFTAVKVESEGCLDRRNRCTTKCTLGKGRPHLGCKDFRDTKVANDFILKYLAKHGLAKRCKVGESRWSYLYAPKTPLAFSRVYTDSETEWTTTLLLKEASDVLYSPILVDAWNELAKANGNGINVNGSGMHTAFIQGENGIYPSTTAKDQVKLFDNFAKSMRPLLPALYLLGANRMEKGKAITRSTDPRCPMISNHEKYSAIAYRQGALEFRVFDTCYDNRDQLLDNIVVMAQAVSKYWHAKYQKPNVTIDKPVYFGTTASHANVNKLESLFVVKEHIVILNAGLRCIKPPYLTVTQIKKARGFKLTVRGVKQKIDIVKYQKEYKSYLDGLTIKQTISSARTFYELTQNLQYDRPADLKSAIAQFHKKANKKAKDLHPVSPIEEIAYRGKFGAAYPLGEF